MTLDILAKIVDTLTGSLVGSTLEQIREKAKRREIVIRTLEAVGLRPDAPPPDFDGVYAYTLVEYGVGKPKPVLDFFRHEFIREAFRKSFEQRERSILDNEAENLLDWSELGEELRQMDYDPRREFAQFAAVFNTLADRTRTVAEVKRDQKLEDVHKTVQEIVARLEKLDELPALRAEMERLHYERYEAELPDTDDVHGEFRVAESLEAQILQILYVYLQDHPGDPRMSFNDLIRTSRTKETDITQCLYGLQEKGWLRYDLTDRAETGLVWLTQLGIRVARDVQES